MSNEWREMNRFPAANGKWQLLRPPVNKIHSGHEKVKKTINSWHIYDPVLITTPQSTRFLPPICTSEFGEKIFLNFKEKVKISIFILSFAIIFSLIQQPLLKGNSNSSKIIYILLFLLVNLLIERFLIFRKIESVQERALFFNWVFSKKNASLKIFAPTILLFGGAQFYYILQLGTLESLITHYGIYFRATESGEIWRYLIGNFFHANLSHWIINALLGILAIGLADSTFEKNVIPEFLLLLIASTLTSEYFPYFEKKEAFVGISGGIFGILGWLTIYSFMRKKFVPQYFGMSLLCFSLFNLMVASASSSNSSYIAHLSGFCFGLLLGVHHAYRSDSTDDATGTCS